MPAWEIANIEEQKRVHFAIMLPGMFANSTCLALKKGVLGQEQSPHASRWIILVIFFFEKIAIFVTLKEMYGLSSLAERWLENTFGLDILRAADES